MVREPASSLRRQVVVANAAAARARMDDLVVACVDRDVVDAFAISGEEEEVTYFECSARRRHILPNLRLLPRGAWKLNAMSSENVLDEARAIEAFGRCAAPDIAGANVIVGSRKDCSCGRTGRGRATSCRGAGCGSYTVVQSHVQFATRIDRGGHRDSSYIGTQHRPQA